MCALLSVRGSVKPVGPSNVLSMAQLRTLPLVDQVKTLMKNGRLPHKSIMEPFTNRSLEQILKVNLG